ncbi:MAG: ABC transporter substrate-binding protein, partial [Chloroflexota bacterium]
LFLPLNDLIEEYGVETKKMFDASPNVRDLITAPDGNIYGMPHVNECYHCTLSQKLWINKIWLDNLGLEVPTTTEELYQVLKAFKEQDPNGNGIADEIPLAGAISGWNTNIDGFLMNPFIYSNHYNGNNYLTLENGQIDAAFNKPEWKDGLKFLRRLAEEGLLSDQTFTQDGGQLKQMGENPDVAILGAAPHGSMTGFTQAYGESERWLTYISVPALEGPTGNRVAAHDPFRVSSGRFIITSAAANPEVAFRWADGFYDRETTLRSVFGARLGEDWRWADDGEIGINGLPAIWNRGETFGQVNNFAWSQAGISYRPNELRLGEVADNPERNLEVLLYDASKENYEPYQRPFDQLIPPLFFDEAQSLELADMSVGINDYVKEMVARFVTGEADIDAEWDDYLATLDSLGLARYIEIHQEAFDAK